MEEVPDTYKPVMTGVYFLTNKFNNKLKNI